MDQTDSTRAFHDFCRSREKLPLIPGLIYESQSFFGDQTDSTRTLHDSLETKFGTRKLKPN